MNTTIDIDSTEEINRQGFTLKKQHTQDPQCIKRQLIYYECLITHSASGDTTSFHCQSDILFFVLLMIFFKRFRKLRRYITEFPNLSRELCVQKQSLISFITVWPEISIQ